MSRILPVIKKELRGYFNSPIAYIVVVFFLVFTSVWLFYINQFVVQNTATLRTYFGIIPLLFIILLPALTMRSWAEERRMKTDELLLTFPVSEGSLVVGKFIGALALLALSLVLTLFVPILVSGLGDFESGQIIGQYLGTLLLGSAGIAAGLFMSSITRNQISAFLFGVVFLLVLTLIGQLAALSSLPTALINFLQYLSFQYHFESFSKGLLDTRDLIYFLLITVFFLYLNTQVLLYRKEG